MEHYPFTILDRSKARELEILRYYYERFRELYPDESERYMDAMYVRYVQGSTAIEGNTITLREAQELLDHAISPAGKKMDEVYEILNFLKLRSFLSEYGGDLTSRSFERSTRS